MSLDARKKLTLSYLNNKDADQPVHPHSLISAFVILFLENTLARGSYTSDHVFLNLLNELRKRDKMRGLSSISWLFRNKFNKFENTGARMLDSIYHMALKLLKNHILA